MFEEKDREAETSLDLKKLKRHYSQMRCINLNWILGPKKEEEKKDYKRHLGTTGEALILILDDV